MAKIPKSKLRTVQGLVAGETVRPDKDWKAYTASCQARIQLNPDKGYKVMKPLKNGWLSLEPGDESSFTTIVYVLFEDANELVKVV